MLNKNEKWFLKITILYQIVIFGLLALAVTSVSLGVAILVQDITFDYLLILTLVALMLSWMMASGGQRAWKSSFLLFVSGGICTFFLIGDIFGVILSWLGTIPDLIWQVFQSSDQISIEMSAFQAEWITLQLMVRTQISDLSIWFRSILAGKPGFNYTASAMIWGLAIWLTAAWAGWFQRRRNQSLAAVLPCGVLLLSVMGYTYGPTTPLLLLLFATLLLVAANHYILKEKKWKERSMDFSEAKRGEIFSQFTGLSLAFILAAALIPRISVSTIIEKVQEWVNPSLSQVEPFLQSFGLEQGAVSEEYFYEPISGGLPRQHLLDTGPEISDQVVMQVKLVNLSPADLNETIGPLLYWRSHTYDRYTGNGWQTSPVSVQVYSANEETHPPTEKGSIILQQDFRLKTEKDFIYAAGEIIALDEDFQLAWRSSPETTDTQSFNGDLFAGTVQEKNYRVISQFPVASESELRASAGVYPSWIAARYRALPSSLPTRVRDLALQLTRTAPTPYDKARAIEAYLRTFKYQLKLPDPPRNRDVVDTFLFELQKGYCDYFASAMVVMARAAGLPARLAVGYTRGTYDSTKQAFIITGENAHTWVEIYFAGIGWVPFEPTAAQPEIIRSQLEWESHPDIESTPGIDLREILTDWNYTPWLKWLTGFLVGTLLLIGIWFLWDTIYLKFLPPSQLAIILFRRLFRYGSQLGVASRAGDTPYEFVTHLEEQINAINQPYFLQVPGFLRTLSQLYVRASFSPRPLTKLEKYQLLHLWPSLRRKLLRASWLYFQKENHEKRARKSRNFR